MSWLGIVLAESVENLIENPSLETNNTGYVNVNDATNSRSDADSKWGAHSLAIVPSDTVTDSGVYYQVTGVATETAHTFSLWVRGINGAAYRIRLYDGVNTALCVQTFTGTGAWQYVEVTGTTVSNTTIRCYLTKDTAGATTPLYTDGWQLEAKAYSTTYCLSPDSIILTKEGIQRLFNIQEGEIFIGQTGEENALIRKWSVVTDAFQLTLDNGSSIIASGDHKFLAISYPWGNSKWRWKPLEEIRVDDYIKLYNHNVCVEDSNHDSEWARAYVLGYLLGDGYVCSSDSRNKPLVAWQFGIKQWDLAKRLENLYTKAFPADWQGRYPHARKTSETEIELRTQNYETFALIYEAGFPVDCKASEKYLPNVVWDYSTKELLAFLAGYVDSDGSVDNRGNLAFNSSSKKLMAALHLLISTRLGIHGWLAAHVNSTAFSNGPRTMYRIGFKLGDTVAMRNLGLELLHPKKSVRLKNAEGTKRRRWAKVKEIIPLGKKELIEVTLAPGHTFIANGLVTHNCDGDQPGCEWTGVEHASTSQRSAQERSGGRIYDFYDDYDTCTDEISGFGMPPVKHNTRKMALQPGELMDNIMVQPRVITLTQWIDEDANRDDLHSRRKELIDAIKKDAVATLQPFRLLYNGLTTVDDPLARAVYCDAYYDTGLEGRWQHKGREEFGHRMIACDPFLYGVGDSAAHLDTSDSATFRIVAARLRSTGQWDELGPPDAAGTYTWIHALAEDETYVYFGGSFANFDNIANADNIVRYNKSTGVYSALGTGLNGVAYSMTVGADGTLYAAGAFTLAGGVAGTARVAAWDGTAWSALATGVDNGIVYTLAIAPNGHLYIGGSFTQIGAVAMNRNAVWDGAAWAALGVGTDGPVVGNAFAPDGTLYVTGSFFNAGGAGASRVASWDGTNWSALGTGLNSDGYFVIVGADGVVYVGGAFTTAGGNTVNRIAQWNGASWSDLDGGTNGDVRCLAIGADNVLYASGGFTEAGGLDLTNCVARWNGTSWSHLDVDLPGSPPLIYEVMVSSADPVVSSNYDIWLGFSASGTGSFAGSATVTNNGTCKAFPRIVISRSGGTSATLTTVRNETTGKELLFDYDLLDGEELTIDLRRGRKTIASDFRGNVLGDVLPDSDFATFSLMPGDNNITCFVDTAGSPTMEAYMVWKDTYWSADGIA